MVGEPAEQRRINGTLSFHLDNRFSCRLQWQSVQTESAAPHRVTHPKNSALSSEGNRGGNAAHLLCCGSSLSLHG